MTFADSSVQVTCWQNIVHADGHTYVVVAVGRKSNDIVLAVRRRLLSLHRSHVQEQAALIDWVIVGGESGPGARPCDIGWVLDIVGQCSEAGVPSFVKQLGARAYDGAEGARCDGEPHEWAWLSEQGMRDRKGGDPSEWPADLQVRQFPGAHP